MLFFTVLASFVYASPIKSDRTRSGRLHARTTASSRELDRLHWHRVVVQHDSIRPAGRLLVTDLDDVRRPPHGGSIGTVGEWAGDSPSSPACRLRARMQINMHAPPAPCIYSSLVSLHARRPTYLAWTALLVLDMHASSIDLHLPAWARSHRMPAGDMAYSYVLVQPAATTNPPHRSYGRPYVQQAAGQG
jgi:hypothetical protein